MSGAVSGASASRQGTDFRTPRASPHPQPHFIVEGPHPTFCTHVAAGDDAITASTDHVGLHGAAPPVRAGARGIVHNQQLSLLQDVRSSPVG